VLTAPGAAGKSVSELGAADLASEFALGCRLWFGSHLDVPKESLYVYIIYMQGHIHHCGKGNKNNLGELKWP